MNNQNIKTEALSQNKTGKVKGKARHKLMNKARAQAYLTRATCIACAKVFRSPKKRLAHVESGHKILIGWNSKRSAKGTSALGRIEASVLKGE